MNEGQIQKQITDYLESRGYLAIRLNAGRVVSLDTGKWIKLAPAGSPDLMVIAPGRIDFLEVKTEKGKLENTQLDMHKLLTEYELKPCVVRSVSDVEAIYQDWPNGNRKLMMQVVYKPRTRTKGYPGEYVSFEEWEQTNAAS